MKIYTRTGDRGKTTLAGGKPVSKTHIRIEAYGTVDELIAHLGLIRDLVDQPEVKAYLLKVQDNLMAITAILATDEDTPEIRVPSLEDVEVAGMEKLIDAMETGLKPLNSFILPGGHIVSSQCHIARTICRRAERQIIRLSEELFVPATVIKYVNRLSDYLFVLARKILHDAGLEDIRWKPEL